MRTCDAWIVAVTTILAAAIGSPGTGWAIEKGGTAIVVSQMAAATGGAGDRTLVVDGPVYMGDVIGTGPKGLAQIHLRDDTMLVVGPNSYMTVDSFVFSGAKATDISLNAVRGAFRFITGASAKSAYQIKTPTATIGVRGTRFDFSIDRRGRMALALYEGAAQLCNRWHQCFTVTGVCSVALTQRFRQARPATPEERVRLLQTAFPFVDNQKKLAPAFRVDTSGCDIQPAGIIMHDARGRPILVPSWAGAGSFGSFGGVAIGGAGGGVSAGRGNNGFGNGGEGSEGSTETGNPGGGGGGGNGHH
jgi:hypothetical protein